MRALKILLAGGCLATLVNCQAPTSLVVTTADPQTLIEASYAEGGRTIGLRASRDHSAIVSDILDERGNSVTSLARVTLQRQRLPVPALLSNAAALSRTLPLAAGALQRLKEALPPAAAESALFVELSRQRDLLAQASATVRVAILQEWGSEARRRIPMTAEEGGRFFALLRRQARDASPGTAAASELASLFGPERYARYLALRRSWLAPAGGQVPQVLP